MPKGNAKKKSILDNHERYGAEGGGGGGGLAGEGWFGTPWSAADGV